jgi:outer membrane protein assembly factor BamB
MLNAMIHCLSTLVFTCFVLAGTCAARADWHTWRGPLGTGQVAGEQPPLTWSKTENVKWQVPLDGPGNSSPIVVGDQVFITHAPAKSNLRGLNCYDRSTGKVAVATAS